MLVTPCVFFQVILCIGFFLMVAGTYANLSAIDSGHALDVQPIDMKPPPIPVEVPVVDLPTIPPEKELKLADDNAVKGSSNGSL